MNDVLILGAAAFLAGALNAVAGGGSFLTLPALVFTGVPPVVANATGTLALLPGYLSGAWAYRDAIRASKGMRMSQLIGLSVVGGIAGALLLLFTSSEGFERLVPWLLLAATVLFIAGPAVSRRFAERAPVPRVGGAGLFAISVYGGYFNGGLGILLMSFFGLVGERNLHVSIGLKNVVSTVLTAVAVVVYIAGGLIEWDSVWLMMVSATAGGYAGARLAQRMPVKFVRWFVVLVGLSMTVVFFLRLR